MRARTSETNRARACRSQSHTNCVCACICIYINMVQSRARSWLVPPRHTSVSPQSFAFIKTAIKKIIIIIITMWCSVNTRPMACGNLALSVPNIPSIRITNAYFMWRADEKKIHKFCKRIFRRHFSAFVYRNTSSSTHTHSYTHSLTHMHVFEFDTHTQRFTSVYLFSFCGAR